MSKQKDINWNGGKWSHPSVLALLKSEQQHAEPRDIICRKAQQLIEEAMALGWEGPPFNPETLASLLGIELNAVNGPIGSEARIYGKSDGTLRIEYDKAFPARRVNFSIFHELVHTFFPDCYEMVRCRNNQNAEEKKHKELESLCDLGAAELLMPESPFRRDLNKIPASLQSIVSLADLYNASIEATMIRAARFSEVTFATAVLSEKFKPSEERTAQTRPLGFIGTDLRPKLRIDYVIPTSQFRSYIPKNKSAPDDSVAYKALANEGVQEGREEWNIPEFGVRRIQAVALPKINGINRAAVFFFDS